MLTSEKVRYLSKGDVYYIGDIELICYGTLIGGEFSIKIGDDEVDYYNLPLRTRLKLSKVIKKEYKRVRKIDLAEDNKKIYKQEQEHFRTVAKLNERLKDIL